MKPFDWFWRWRSSWSRSMAFEEVDKQHCFVRRILYKIAWVGPLTYRSPWGKAVYYSWIFFSFFLGILVSLFSIPRREFSEYHVLSPMVGKDIWVSEPRGAQWEISGNMKSHRWRQALPTHLSRQWWERQMRPGPLRQLCQAQNLTLTEVTLFQASVR